MSHLADDSLLSSAERLVLDERYSEALHEIDRLRRNKIERGTQLRCGILESRCFSGLGDFGKAIKAAQDVVDMGSKFQEHKMDVIDGLLEMADASWGLGLPDMILETCSKAEKLRTELSTEDESLLDSIKANILFHESLGWYMKDDVHRAIECACQSLSIREGLEDVQGIVSSLLRVGYLHIEVNLDQALEYVERGLMLNKQLRCNGHVIFGYSCKACIELMRCNWDECEQLASQALTLVKKHNHRRWMLWPLFLFSNMSLVKGDFRRSLEYSQEYLAKSEKANAQLHIGIASVYMGEIFRARGDFENALKAYERSMEINRKMGRSKGYIVSMANCGMVEIAMGHPDEALMLLEESLMLAEKQEQAGLLGGFIRPYNILNIVSILVDKGLVNEAQQRVERARLISEETNALYDTQAYRIAAALVLKSSMLPRSRKIAKEYLIDVIDGSFIDYELTAMALLNLAEILVNELQMTGNQDILDALETRLDALSTLANRQDSGLLLIETLLLQSKVALLQLDAARVNRLLDQAKIFAQEKGIDRILERIANEHSILLNELGVWENLGENSPPMAKRAEKARIQEQIYDMIRQGTWRKMLF